MQNKFFLGLTLLILSQTTCFGAETPADAGLFQPFLVKTAAQRFVQHDVLIPFLASFRNDDQPIYS